MDKIKEDNLYIRILKFGEAHPLGFNYKKLETEVRLNNWEEKIIKKYMYNAILNNRPGNKVLHESIFLESRIDERSYHTDRTYATQDDSFFAKSELDIINIEISKTYFILKYDAYFNYIDYLELQKAIKNSNEAKWWAIGSILIAIITGAFQISKDSLLLDWICHFF